MNESQYVRASRAVTAACTLAFAAACGQAGAVSRWVAEIDTVGDTIVVRTLSGGIWADEGRLVADLRIGELEGQDEYLLGNISGLAVGPAGEMYVYDSQGPSLRKYGRDGRYIATIGREGGGPGEYKESDGGLILMKDGRLVLRDPGNARFQLYSPEGQPAGEWRYVGGMFTSTPLFADTAGNAYASAFDLSQPPPWRNRLSRHAPDGTAADTIEATDFDFEAATIRAEKNSGQRRSRSLSIVPFSPTQQWSFSPHGYFVVGITDRYAILLARPEGLLRIERAVAPVPVDPAEKANAEELSTANMREVDSDWKWNGPGIPDTKPAFQSIRVAEDARIWVRVSMPGERIPEDEVEVPERRPDGIQPPARRWREPVAFDVFEPDGRFVGRVRAPTGFSMNPAPVIRGDTVWAIQRDELGVQRLVRFRIEFGQTPE
jgi:hypothetical protein